MLFNIKNHEYTFRIKISPNSSKNKIGECFVDQNSNKVLKVFVNAIPEKGKANKELIKLLSKEFNILKSSIFITHGKLDRNKIILLSDITSERIKDLEKEFSNVK